MLERDESSWSLELRDECLLSRNDRAILISEMMRPYASPDWMYRLTFRCANCFSKIMHSILIAKEYGDELKERREEISAYAPWSEEYQDDKEYLEVLLKRRKRKSG